MTETTEERRTGEVVTADATGWQHRNSLSVAVTAEDPSDGFACLQRVDLAVMLIRHDFLLFFVVLFSFLFFHNSSIGCKRAKATV